MSATDRTTCTALHWRGTAPPPSQHAQTTGLQLTRMAMTKAQKVNGLSSDQGHSQHAFKPEQAAQAATEVDHCKASVLLSAGSAHVYHSLRGQKKLEIKLGITSSQGHMSAAQRWVAGTQNVPHQHLRPRPSSKHCPELAHMPILASTLRRDTSQVSKSGKSNSCHPSCQRPVRE